MTELDNPAWKIPIHPDNPPQYHDRVRQVADTSPTPDNSYIPDTTTKELHL